MRDSARGIFGGKTVLTSVYIRKVAGIWKDSRKKVKHIPRRNKKALYRANNNNQKQK